MNDSRTNRSTPVVRCFPRTTDANPYQQLMMAGLRRAGLDVDYGNQHRIFGPLLTALDPRVDYLNFDWLNHFYYRASLPPVATWLNGMWLTLQCWIIRRLLGKKIVWTVHNLVPHNAASPVTHRRVYRAFARWGADLIRVFAPATQDRLQEQYGADPARIVVIPEGDYRDYYAPPIDQATARQRLGLTTEGPLLLQLGSIRPYKGVVKAVEAFAKYAWQHPWSYLVVGHAWDQPYTEHALASAARYESVQVVPRFVDDDEMHWYFSAADAVICPYNEIENSGAVILAMGFGKAIIAPRTGVLPERLRAQPELLYETRIEEALAVLDTLNPEQLRELGQRNLQELDRYRWEDLARCFR